MSDATATPEIKSHPSLFTRLRVVEAELHTLKALFAHLKEDHEALREDRDEWRWRADIFWRRPRRGFLTDGASELRRRRNPSLGD